MDFVNGRCVWKYFRARLHVTVFVNSTFDVFSALAMQKKKVEYRFLAMTTNANAKRSPWTDPYG